MMDQHGMEMMILSLNAPDRSGPGRSGRRPMGSRARANDALADGGGAAARRSRRWPALPMQDVELATRELERCVTELKFCGALVNGFSQRRRPRQSDLLRHARTIGRSGRRWSGSTCRSICIRATRCRPGRKIYQGHEWLLGPTWAFGVEAATHALRLMGSGLFDRCPRLNMILGHLGEGLPYSMWRVDNRNAWSKAPHRMPGQEADGGVFPCEFPSHHGGQFPQPDADRRDAGDRRGPHHVLDGLSVRGGGDAADWFDAAPISEADRVKIGRQNAIRLFKLALR